MQDASAPQAYDVELTAEADTPVASLLAALPVKVADRPCYLAGVALDPTATLGDCPLVSGAVVTVGAPGAELRALPPGTAGAVQVLAGPDAGRTAWLTEGTHTIGRAPEASLCLSDPLVSRKHTQLCVGPDQVLVSDLGSGNGTFLDGAALADPTPWTAGSLLAVGDNVLCWTPVPPQGLAVTRSRDGHLDFDRAFAPAPAIPTAQVDLPLPAEPPVGRGYQLLMSAAAPVVLGVVMATVLHQPYLLLMAAFAPVAALTSGLGERRQRRAREARYQAATASAGERITASVVTEERVRRRIAPDPVELRLTALGAGRGLWPRNADSQDALLLRVGVADLPASVSARGQRPPGFVEPVLTGVPVTLDLRAAGVLGIIGSPVATAPAARWIAVQLATLRSPDDLRLVIITADDGTDLAWTRWLPHVDAGAESAAPCLVGNTPATRSQRISELRELVLARQLEQVEQPDRRAARFGTEVVVLLDGALALRHLPGMREVLRDGPSVGVHSICVDRQDLNECRAVLDLANEPVLISERSAHPQPLRPEGMPAADAERLARALAPMRDRLTLASGQDAIPQQVRFLDLLEVSKPTGADVLDLWAQHPGPTTEVVLGADAAGPVTVDLARQGPHTMLAGATGAGKSILLQTLVTSLLLANRPDELNLVLVDFKGGSAFLPFERCPHVVGLIRSTGETPADVFDEAAAVRVLASVRAEVRRRESLLARYGGEIDAYWAERHRVASMPALPRLVMVFDEFARVLETSPDFLKELVNVAAKGRSLGMHLVLATQSLQGKLSPELKNNIDLRITLRQNEKADSVEVLGVPDAVLIPGRLRGRGLILCTKDEGRTPQPFQSGYLGDPPPELGAAPARLRLVDWSVLGRPRPIGPAEPGNGARSDQQLAIAAIEDAATRLNLPAPRPPLRAPLPAVIPLPQLRSVATITPAPDAVPLGLADDPQAQEQPVLALDLAGTDRLLIAGGPQSGRTTAVRALLTGLVTGFGPSEVHVYVVEQQPAGLARYANLPHVGAVLGPAEPDRVRRLVTWLGEEVQRRRVAQLAAAPGTAPGPRVVVVVDGWELIENRSDPAWVETSVLTTLRAVVTAGPTVGVHVVATGGQVMMSGRLPELFSRRVLLPFPKEETRRQHLGSGVVSPPVLPGRAIEAGSGLHVQMALPDGDPIGGGDLTVEGGLMVGGGLMVDGQRTAKEFPPLPLRVSAESGFESGVESGVVHGSGSGFVLGVGGPDVEPLRLDLFEGDPHTLLVTGPAGSGRSTALATVACGLRRAGIGVLVVAPPRSPLASMLQRLLPQDAGLRLVAGTAVPDADLRAAASRFGDGRFAVLVDDCEQVSVIPSKESFMDAPTLLQEVAAPSALGHRALVLAGDAGPIVTGRRPALNRVVGEILTGGTRVLLSPATSIGARELGVVLEPDQFFAGPPGRGYLATGRSTTLLQLAMPDPVTA
ncbi:MAG TPA: FtsK/SpoIIIE domain-containing protein [Kineosporiaceae bacterium]|nr:FtsK/SpoIIIE domain-containing protein [Kineosporiaceae bacterium]